MDVRVSMFVCVSVCVCMCVCIRLDLSFYAVNFNQTGLIFLCDCVSKIRFLIGLMGFCFISNFRFSQNCFLPFINDRVRDICIGWVAFER